MRRQSPRSRGYAQRVPPAPQDVLAVALEAYVSIDSDGRVVAWNPAAEATFGYSETQALGQHIEELIIPERFHTAHRQGIQRAVAGEPGRVLGRRLELSARHRDGHELPVEMTLTVTHGPAGPLFHAFAHDVTVAHRARRFAAVEAAVARGLAHAAGSGQAAEHVVEALGATMDWPVVELWLLDGDRQVLSCAARWETREVDDFVVNELPVGVGLPGMVCRDVRPRWISDLAVDGCSPRSPAAARYGLHVAVGVPISSGEQVLGALAVYGDRAEDPEDSFVSLLTGIAAHLGQYLERRRAEELTVELAQTKDDFLALVSHELLNPLAVITGTTALFNEDLGTLSIEQQRDYLQTITGSAQRLAAMAGDLLDLSRLESGQPAVHPTAAANLTEVIAQAVDVATMSAADKHLTITVDVDDPIELVADAGRLLQVADNLLSNAVKYTPEGGTITVTAHTDEPWITWTVADTGIGIPAAERPRLFRRFYRASTALDRRIPGTGLGLVITRAIIERHHGTITLTDHAGPGTTFAVEL
ncbi:MAG TPA: ATP-binding protein, partial [Catenuloplanes sp.]